MTTTLPPGPASVALAQLGAPLYRLTVAQYHAMLEAGILAEGEKCELIEGILVQKMTQGRGHVICVTKLSRALTSTLPKGWHLEAQPAIIASDRSEPEPDVVLLRGELEDYPEHPEASAVGIVIEVSDSSLNYDRTGKKRVYAFAGIPIYWIVNLRERKIEVYTDPTGPTEAPDYRTRRDFGEDESVPVTLDQSVVAHIPVQEILP